MTLGHPERPHLLARRRRREQSEGNQVAAFPADRGRPGRVGRRRIRTDDSHDQVARLIARRDRLATAPRCGKQENEMETAHRSDQVREGSSPCL